MKKVLFGSLFMAGLLFTGCSGEVNVEGGEEGGEEEVAALSCADLNDQVDDLIGQEVTIKAISWGNSATMDGDVKMNLGDEKLEGMQQASVVVNFSADNASAAEGIEKDAEVTIKATVGEAEYGAVQLSNPEIIK
jgi:hypothetical protein